MKLDNFYANFPRSIKHIPETIGCRIKIWRLRKKGFSTKERKVRKYKEAVKST